MNEVSTFRLYVLRAMYLFIVAGLGAVVWPGVIRPHAPWEFMEGSVNCMLVAFSLLCALGLRYPLQMLPVLLWEALWKTVWLAIVALPQYRSGQVDAQFASATFNCALVVLLYLAIPWPYVLKHYVKKHGDRWSLPSAAQPKPGRP
jgi:hypothetical protein